MIFICQYTELIDIINMHVPVLLLYCPTGHAVQAPADDPPHSLRYCPSMHDDSSQIEHEDAPVWRTAKKDSRSELQ
jgi:hypothetical protein